MKFKINQKTICCCCFTSEEQCTYNNNNILYSIIPEVNVLHPNVSIPSDITKPNGSQMNIELIAKYKREGTRVGCLFQEISEQLGNVRGYSVCSLEGHQVTSMDIYTHICPDVCIYVCFYISHTHV